MPSLLLVTPWSTQAIENSYKIALIPDTQQEVSVEQKTNNKCRQSRVPVLLYHHIREYENLVTRSAKDISVSPQEFTDQMKFLHDQGYSTITTDAIKRNSVPCKSVMITFDDGHFDVIQNAYPIMEQLGFVGIIPLIIAKIDTSDYLYGNDIRFLRDKKWEIGSHTWNHKNLKNIKPGELFHEIIESKIMLEKWFNISVHTFVYPGGVYTKKIMNVVNEGGYKYAFNTHYGSANLVGSKLELKRINIEPGISIDEFQKLLIEAK